MQRYGVGDGAREERGVGHQQPRVRLLDAQPHQGAKRREGGREGEILALRASSEPFFSPRAYSLLGDAKNRGSSLFLFSCRRTHARTPDRFGRTALCCGGESAYLDEPVSSSFLFLRSTYVLCFVIRSVFSETEACKYFFAVFSLPVQ